jgi:hypothetical protein
MSLIYFALAAPGLLMMYVTTLVFVRADAVLLHKLSVYGSKREDFIRERS